MTCHLTLFIPGLLSPPAGFSEVPASEFPDLSVLSKLLSRADLTANSTSGFYAELFDCFGVQLNDDTVPVAALSRFLSLTESNTTESNTEKEEVQDWHLCIDPVYLQADLTAAYLLAHDALNLQSDEANQIIATLNEHFAQDGWQINMASNQRWYLSGSDKTAISTTSMHKAMGCHVGHCMPEGDDAAYWRSVMNEVQMLLHEHPVNQAREEAGLLPVNSVWVWGEGHMVASTQHDWNSVYSNELTSQALAHFSDIPCHGLPQDINSILKEEGNVLYLNDHLFTRQHGFDIYYWLTALHEVEQALLTPVMNAMQSGQLDELTVMSGDGRSFNIKRKQLKRWWKRNKPLSHWVLLSLDQGKR